MTYETELAAMQAEMDTTLVEINAIKDQLLRARAEQKVTGVYSDAKWFASANAALKHKQLLHQQLQVKLAAFKRRAKLESSQSFERTFLQVARDLLCEPVYRQLIDKTHKVISEKNDVTRS